jgi:DNA-binding transcriptional regulator YdaS (Cro superfamily)
MGGRAALARALGLTPTAVEKWSRLSRIPAERVLDIERVTQGRVSRYDLRPDLYPREE